MALGRAVLSGGDNGAARTNVAELDEKRVNVLATGSVDQSVKVWTP